MIIFLRQCTTNRKMWLGGLLCSILGTRLCAYNQKTLFITLYVGYCVQLGRFCPQEQHRVTQQLGKFHQSNTGLSQKQFQQVCLVDAVYKCFLRCINEWPLYLKIWGSINCTMLCTWWELAYNQAKANNYDIIINHAHIRFVSKEKGAVGHVENLQNLKQFPLQLGSLLLLQQIATTVVTWCHWDPEILTCMGDIRVCVLQIQEISHFNDKITP